MTEVRFAFGRNWAAFSRHITPARLAAARASLQRLLGRDSLAGCSFLDLGCGSGLFALAAAQLGASLVVGVDVDPDSVATARANRRRWMPCGPLFFERLSILDADAMQALGTFDIVYSWGVLHHTGDMRRALRLSAARVRAGGLLAIAIYNRHWSSPGWVPVKRFYNRLPRWGQHALVALFYPLVAGAKALVTRRNPFRMRRGMDFYYNLVDWLGGYPYEYASIAEVRAWLTDLGFEVLRVYPAPVPTGCNEFVARAPARRVMRAAGSSAPRAG